MASECPQACSVVHADSLSVFSSTCFHVHFQSLNKNHRKFEKKSKCCRFLFLADVEKLKQTSEINHDVYEAF